MQVKVVMGRGKRGYDQWHGGRMPGKMRYKGTQQGTKQHILL